MSGYNINNDDSAINMNIAWDSRHTNGGGKSIDMEFQLKKKCTFIH